MSFLLIGRVFIQAQFFLFLANPNKNSFHPMGNFCTRKLTFSSRKLVLFVKKCHSTFNARHLSPFGMTKKLFCALARIFWPSARFWDFFGLQKAFGLLQAKKIPKTALRPKNLAAAQFFLSFLMLILSCISTLKYTN